MNLSQMRTLVRRDLHDEDAAAYRWTDNELDRHIDRAVKEFSLAVPLDATATLTTVAGSRDLSLAALADRIVIEAVEYPVGRYPPSYVRFSLWADTLKLLIDGTPAAGEPVTVYYGKLHTLDATMSTIPMAMEDVVASGAAAYAALEWASFATNRINSGGADVWRNYLVFGENRLAAFARALATFGRRNRIRVQRLYRPATDIVSKSIVTGP
jgi:hypothetical protein